jgi:REP element-mobilizing transposase RayT
MARPLRVEYEGAVYHITLRGNNRRIIFKDDSDRERFIQKLAESVQQFDVRLYLFCLMENHVHFVLETPRANLSRFMHRLLTAYTVYFNRKHNESGHLMQGRFGATVVDEDEYILKLSRYVHLNPVYIKAYRNKPVRERIQILRKYHWSSYRSYIGKAKSLDFVNYGPVLEMMGRPKKKQSAVYRRFVECGISDIDAAFIETKKRSRLCIGSDECHRRMDAYYQEMLESFDKKEDVSFRRESKAHSVEEVLGVVCEVLQVNREVLTRRSKDSIIRPVVAKMLCQYSGLTQRQAAEIVGVRSGVAVCLQIRKVDERVKKDRGLQRHLAQIEKLLRQREKKGNLFHKG